MGLFSCWHSFLKSFHSIGNRKSQTKRTEIMSVIKIIEVIASSNKGFTEAAQNAVAEASRTVKNIKSVYIKEMKANVENNKITTYAVNAKVSFLIEDK